MQVVDENGNYIQEQNSKRVLAGILAILFGWSGLHKFILGYVGEGIAMFVLTFILAIVTCGVFTGLMGLIGLIEGVIYLTKSDEEFIQTYQVNKKGWF